MKDKTGVDVENRGREDNRVKKGIALWVITPNGVGLAKKLSRQLSREGEKVSLFCSEKLGSDNGMILFDRLGPAVARAFDRHGAHVFFAAVGIGVRMISPHIIHKTRDPAVVCVDDGGHFAVSILSGHLGGGNALAHRVAHILGAVPVITTATDANQRPAVDLAAQAAGCTIENPAMIKPVNMALLKGKPISLSDYFNWVRPHLPPKVLVPGVWPQVVVTDQLGQDLRTALILRPPSLFAGIGCNRGTPEAEIRELLISTLEREHLALGSLVGLASIDLKGDEQGLLDLGAHLDVPIDFYTKDELNRVQGVQNPSRTVEKCIGVHSVCEAAALMAARARGNRADLIVTKTKTRNVTLAMARRRRGISS